MVTIYEDQTRRFLHLNFIFFFVNIELSFLVIFPLNCEWTNYLPSSHDSNRYEQCYVSGDLGDPHGSGSGMFLSGRIRIRLFLEGWLRVIYNRIRI